MPQDINTGTDGVALNALGSCGGALVATDLVSVNGNAAAHVQYVKLGWGGSGDVFYPVGDETYNATSRPLPVMLRHTDGTAIGGANNVLDIRIASQGLTLDVNTSHSASIGIQGTAGMHPLEIEGSSGAAAVWISATAGTTLPTNGVNTLPVMLFGLSGNTGEPIGSTNGKLQVFHTDAISVNPSNASGLFVSATAGTTLPTNGVNTLPVMLFGLSGNTGEPIGSTNGQLKVYHGSTLQVEQILGGSAGIGGIKTQPTLIYGLCAGGPSAGVVAVTGGQRLLTSLDGSRVAVDNHTDKGLYVRATGGLTLPNDGTQVMPMMLFGLCGGAGGAVDAASKMAVPVGVTNGRLDIHLGSSCLTVDVTVTPNMPVISATLDAQHNRYIHVAGPTSNAFKHQESHPVFVTGKADGSTYSYPVGITTSMVGASGGAWQLDVTGGVFVNRWSAGTLTVSATNFDVRGLTAKGGKDSIAVEGMSGAQPVLVAATGSLGHRNIPVHNTMPSMLYGISGSASASGGLSAAAVGITGADMLHVGIGHEVKISAGADSPLYVVSTGGFTYGKTINTYPSLVMGMSSGNSGAAVGMSADMLKVYLDDGISAGRDSISVTPTMGLPGICGSRGEITAYDTMPVLLHGISAGGGGSAAPLGMSGDALNVNLVNAGITVDVRVGTHVEVSNDYGAPLYVAGASAGGACGGQAPYPVSVASNYLGESVFVQGTGGMSPIEVMGFSGSANDLGEFAVGVTSGANWNMASDATLNSLGTTLDKTFEMFVAALGGDDDNDDIANHQFSTKAQMDAMAPDGTASANRIADAKDTREARDFLDTIQSTVTSGPGQDIANQVQVDIVDILQPSAFTAGQKALINSAAQIQTTVIGFTLESGIKLKGHQDNANFIYVGDSSVSTVKGFPLGPSEEVFLEIDNLRHLYAISSTASGLTLCYIGS
jgi:hypothetical protein